MPEEARTDFTRARRPAEIAQRRRAILAAAAELVDEGGLGELSLSLLAQRAGITKSNLYRYFESREEVLLQIFAADFTKLSRRLAARIERLEAGDTLGLGAAIARAFLARPRLCRFLSVLSSVLEENVSEEVIREMKRLTLNSAQPLALALHSRLPGLSLQDCVWALHLIALLVAGFYPSAYPAEAARAVLSQPEFAALRLRPQADLSRAISALLRGLQPK